LDANHQIIHSGERRLRLNFPAHWPGARPGDTIAIAAHRARPAKKGEGLYWLFVALTLILVALMGAATYRTAQILPDWPLDSNPLLLPTENVVRVILLALCLGLGRLSGLSPAVLGWTWPDPLRQTLWGIVWGALIAAIYVLLTRWIVARTGGRYYTPMVVRVIVPKSRGQLAAVAVVMVGVVLVEEMLFRSLLIGGLSPLLPGWVLVGITAAVFGLLHSPQGIWGMAAIAVGGMVLGGMFLAAESLLLPVVAHYVVNMVQLAYAYVKRDELDALSPVPSTPTGVG
jgi:membrane protease YdiL (CAAX protease family)